MNNEHEYREGKGEKNDRDRVKRSEIPSTQALEAGGDIL